MKHILFILLWNDQSGDKVPKLVVNGYIYFSATVLYCVPIIHESTPLTLLYLWPGRDCTYHSDVLSLRNVWCYLYEAVFSDRYAVLGVARFWQLVFLILGNKFLWHD